jgi:pyruvate/2-oxoglutarate dehydrogenase complex dihydrolipoamide dehydrogenase (E3) component
MSVMSDQADVILLGMGTGGEELGGRLAMSGLDVVGIEPELVGGECAYWACIPSKMMIRAANLLQEARRVNGIAGHAEVIPDWAPVAARIREQATGGWDDSLAVGRFKERGGRFVRGRGVLTGPRTVAVNGQSFTATRGLVIATGSKPAVPPIPGLAEVEYWTSHEAIAASELPASLLVLGGGSVGCELGQVFSRFGVDVTILEGADRLLPWEEPEVGEVLASVFETEGIAVHTGARAERVEARGDSVRAELRGGEEVTADKLLVAVGRTVDVDALGVENAGLKVSDGFIEVDEHLRAGDGIWAMGDVTGKALLTHVALYQASIVEAGIHGRSSPPADYSSLPRATFTDPEVGAVGMSEAQARAAGLDVAVAVKKVPATFRGWLHGPGNEGVIKLVVDRRAGVLVGATSVGPHGGDVLGLLAAAVHARIPMEDLRRMIYAFPTFHGGVGEAIGAYARALVQVLDPEAELFLSP